MSTTLTALAAIDHAFAELTTHRPTPMFFDAGTVPGLPDRPMPLQELRLLLQGRIYVEVTDAVWRQLALQARRWRGEWVTAAAGIAAPTLTKMAARIGRKYPSQIEDIDSELVAGFLDALITGPLDPPQWWLRLCWAAWRGGLRGVRHDELLELSWDVPSGSRLPRRPYGHPELLIGRACKAGVISAEAGELIAATRFGGELIDLIAARQGITAHALRQRRRAAELKLATAIRTGDLSGPVYTPKRQTSQHIQVAQNLSALADRKRVTSADRS